MPPPFDAVLAALAADWATHPATLAVGAWGAVVATGVGLYTVWDKHSQKRIRLAVTYGFTEQQGVSDKIIVVNLSALPVHVADWSLTWKPNSFRFFLSQIEVSKLEADAPSYFVIPAQGSYTLEFSEADKFNWSYRVAQHRQLYLNLCLFGYRRKRTLRLRNSGM